MKPAPFAYAKPGTLEEATSLLAAHGGDAKVLAGGQSLLPSMAMRLAQPEVIIDANGLSEIAAVSSADGVLTVGGLVRHAALQQLEGPDASRRLLREAAKHIGHLPVRVRGTIGGSLAHADPSAEWPAVVLALDARLELRSSSGSRSVAADDFFTGPFTTVLRDDEILTAVTFAPEASVTHAGFAEVSRRPGDFAVALAAVALLVAEGTIRWARVAVAGLAGGAGRCRLTEDAVTGTQVRDVDPRAVGAQARRESRAYDDVHSSAEYKLRMAEVAVADAVALALGRGSAAASGGGQVDEGGGER